MNTADANLRPEFDTVIQDIVDYVLDFEVTDKTALETARYCLLDTLGCGFLAQQYPACTKLLGPVVPGLTMEHGARVPGTAFELDPIQAAFNIGTIIRWLDFNDTWLAAEWGHPSDNLGGILAVTDYMNRTKQANYTIDDVLKSMVKAHEIQGCLALENSFNRVGLDHVVLVKVATTAVAGHLLQLTREQLLNAVSLAWVDGQSLRTYRHAPNTGSRKSWAAGDATSRGVRLALIAKQGEMGYPSVLTAKTWGFYDVLFKGNAFSFERPYGSYVMENILFKISFPAEFHAQTAVEAAVILHDEIKDKLDSIKSISLETQEAGVRIISKTGPLHNPADRDHCLQYMVAVGLLHGGLRAEHYEDDVASDPRIDALRDKMLVRETTSFTKDYHNPDKRAIANAIQIEFIDGTKTERVEVAYPIGHRSRREEGIPVLLEKFHSNVALHYSPEQASAIMKACSDESALDAMTVDAFMGLLSCA